MIKYKIVLKIENVMRISFYILINFMLMQAN